MPASVGDVLQIKAYCFQQSQLGLNVHHYLVQATTGEPMALATVASLWATRYWTAARPITTSTARFQGATCQKVWPAPISAVELGNRLDDPGTAGDEPLPKQVSGIIPWKTGLAGRTNRGRSYIPFPDEIHNAMESVPTLPYLVGLSNIGAAISGDITLTGDAKTVTLRHVIWSKDNQLARPVTLSNIPAKWATQRRRGDYGATNTSPF